jgi:hypothetical protein
MAWLVQFDCSNSAAQEGASPAPESQNSENTSFKRLLRHLAVSYSIARFSAKVSAKYAGHSLRAGHATSAAIAGASERPDHEADGHRAVQMVLSMICQQHALAIRLQFR